MTDNEKAASVAGLWEPNRPCKLQIARNDGGIFCGYCGSRHPTHGNCAPEEGTKIAARIDRGWKHDIPAPNMHDPANLWRAFVYLWEHDIDIYRFKDPVDALLSTLVARYDAEHESQGRNKGDESPTDSSIKE